MKQISVENGKNFGIRNLINYNKSDQGRKKSGEIIRKVNELGLNTYIGSEEHLKHILELGHLNGILKEDNGSLYYLAYNKKHNKIIRTPWKEYKEKFIKLYENFNINDLPNEFKIIPTFRKQNSEN